VKAGMETILIRKAQKEDVEEISSLIVRMKRLNNEFDPLFTVSEKIAEKSSSYVKDSLSSTKVLVLVAVKSRKVIGVLRAELKHRYFYIPEVEGRITDFYILPEFRRKALGNEMIEKASSELKKMGAEMITAEVPTLNEIAVRFYNKRGFRSLLQIFAKQ
jgi:ribosomal protein S18 acetylase RimI-like enzyme